ncbi:MAG: YdeI/OmpD-associated family protein [Chitinophagaceae bacterium]
MVKFTTAIRKFDNKGEKTGWSFIDIPADIAKKIKPVKTSFRVKGKLDNHKIAGVALLPMGGGSFIIPLNADMRKALGKRHGAMVKVELEEDKKPFQFNKDFMICLADEPAADTFFKSLPGSHQRYFSKWIDSAKTAETKAKRIAQAVTALAKKMGYAEMLRDRR